MKKYFIFIVFILLIVLQAGCKWTSPAAVPRYIINLPEWITADGLSGSVDSDLFSIDDNFIKCFSHFETKFNKDYKYILSFSNNFFELYNDTKTVCVEPWIFNPFFGIVYDIDKAPIFIPIKDPDIFEYDGYVDEIETHLKFVKANDGFNVYFSNENGEAGPIHFTR